MTAGSLQPRKRRRVRRRRSVRAPAEETGMIVTVARLGFGAWSLGAEQLTKRLEAVAPKSTANNVTAERARRRSRRTPRAVTVGWVAAGLAIESAETISRWATQAADGRRARRFSRMLSRLPGRDLAALMLQRPITRYQASIRRLRERGRVETRMGKQMVSLLIRDTTRRSVLDITESAVNEVAHSPEIAALVRNQSVGVAAGTIREVRENSEQADDRLERRVRSWLHIHKPESADVATGTASTPEPAG